MIKQKTIFLTISGLFILVSASLAQPVIINHTCARLEPIPSDAINEAKSSLHIAYAHTSHGSQITDGMLGLIGQTNLVGYKGDFYQWNDGGIDGALDLHDYFIPGDLGHYGDTTWAPYTRTYLDSNPDVNVIMYSWCGGVSDNTFEGIQMYLDKMNELESDYPGVKFVYMTGHSDIWNDAILKTNNQHIRDYCNSNNKILYDFADIESYNPDGTYFEYTNDNCDYYSDETASNLLGNWAIDWQNSHTEGIDWYNCSSAHSEPLNANLKAYAAWWLWAVLADWHPTTDISDFYTNSQAVSVFPNPTEGNFSIKSDNHKITAMNLYNAIGVKVLTISDIDIQSSLKFDISTFKKGIYFLELFSDDKILFKKIVLQ